MLLYGTSRAHTCTYKEISRYYVHIQRTYFIPTFKAESLILKIRYLTNSTNKQNRQIQRWRADDSGGGGEVRGGGPGQNGSRTHGHGQQCGDCRGEGCKGTKW